MRSDIGVFTCICEEDAIWIDQYLAEIERLDLPYATHLDRCSNRTKARMTSHANCIGFDEQNNHAIEFEERHKQGVFDLVAGAGYQWALAWDIDETWERDAPKKIASLSDVDADYLTCRWLNLWNDAQHIRIDGAFEKGHRVKFYRLDRTWRFDHPITNGAKNDSPDTALGRLDLVCLHHGLMTRELRLQHKERWDRIYSTALRGDQNPYGFWKFACDESIEPTVIRHGY